MGFELGEFWVAGGFTGWSFGGPRHHLCLNLSPQLQNARRGLENAEGVPGYHRPLIPGFVHAGPGGFRC